MKHVIIRSYSRYHDLRTGVEFAAAVDVAAGVLIGHAVVDDALAEEFEKRPSFQVLTDEQFLALSQLALAPEPTEPATGSALGDESGIDGSGEEAGDGEEVGEAQTQEHEKKSGPPPPPASK